MQQGYSSVNWPKYRLIDAFRTIFEQHPTYTWDSAEERTKIQIRDRNAIKVIDTDDRPIIAISRGQVRSQNRVISDLYSVDQTTGTYNYREILETSINVSCLSRYGLIAEELSSIVYGAVKYNKPSLMYTGLIDINPPVIGEEQMIVFDSDYQLVSVSVVFNLTYVIYWSRTPQALLLGDIYYRIRNVNDTPLDST